MSEQISAAVGAEAQELADGRTLSNRELLRALLRKPQFILCSLLLLVFFAMAAVPKLFTSVDPRFCELTKSRQGRISGHPFGFDIQGCDYFANVVYGARPSVLVSICASFGVFVLAGSLGLLAGYFPGFVDALISRTADVLFSIPGIVVLIVILNSVQDRSIWIIVGVILLIGWPGG